MWAALLWSCWGQWCSLTNHYIDTSCIYVTNRNVQNWKIPKDSWSWKFPKTSQIRLHGLDTLDVFQKNPSRGTSQECHENHVFHIHTLQHNKTKGVRAKFTLGDNLAWCYGSNLRWKKKIEYNNQSGKQANESKHHCRHLVLQDLTKPTSCAIHTIRTVRCQKLENELSFGKLSLKCSSTEATKGSTVKGLMPSSSWTILKGEFGKKGIKVK